MLKIFRKKHPQGAPRDRIRGPRLYDYRELEPDALEGYENAIGDIYERKYDGILVRNALPEAECDAILAAVRALPREMGTEMPVGWTFPWIFAQQVNHAFRAGEAEGMAKMQEYFAFCEKVRANAADYFGVDVTARIEDWLRRFSGGLPVTVPDGYDGDGKYAHTTYRSYLPKGVGNISIHCGNYFQTAFGKFYDHLEQQVDVYDQLSYFFCLEQAEEGGALTLYDFEWQDGQTKASTHEARDVIWPDGGVIDIEKRKKMYIDPRKGDLILFAGGQIWHRVEAVRGARERVTLAGFLSYARGKDAIVYWS